MGKINSKEKSECFLSKYLQYPLFHKISGVPTLNMPREVQNMHIVTLELIFNVMFYC